MPSKPPLQLTVDESKKLPYKQKWDLEAPFVSVGVANDGTFLTNSVIQFSDLLGNQRALILAQTVSTFSNISASYINLKNRWNWARERPASKPGRPGDPYRMRAPSQ